MAIPKHDEIRIPAMELAMKSGKMKLKDFIAPLANHFKLSEEEISEMYPSGNGYVFYDRVSWALSYLNMSGLLEKPKRGVYSRNFTHHLQNYGDNSFPPSLCIFLSRLLHLTSQPHTKPMPCDIFISYRIADTLT